MSRSPLRKPVRKVLLISPSGKIFVSPEGARERKLAIPPLGLAYLAARLGGEGYEVSILDVMIEGYEHETPDAYGRTVHYGLPDDAVRARIGGDPARDASLSRVFVLLLYQSSQFQIFPVDQFIEADLQVLRDGLHIPPPVGGDLFKHRGQGFLHQKPL